MFLSLDGICASVYETKCMQMESWSSYYMFSWEKIMLSSTTCVDCNFEKSYRLQGKKITVVFNSKYWHINITLGIKFSWGQVSQFVSCYPRQPSFPSYRWERENDHLDGLYFAWFVFIRNCCVNIMYQADVRYVPCCSVSHIAMMYMPVVTMWCH